MGLVLKTELKHRDQKVTRPYILIIFFRLTCLFLLADYWAFIQQKEFAMHQPSTPSPRLREQLHAVMRTKYYSLRTEKTYWYWIRYFIRFHRLRPMPHRNQDQHHKFCDLADAKHKMKGKV